MVTHKNSTFYHSNQLREEARKLIPLGAQTFTRSYTQFPYNHTPLFLKKGVGGRVWDIDDNEYVDLLSGLLSVILGYCDEDVDAAIRNQLSNGITFSLSTELEVELARLLVDTIPCAEMVRYGKGGSDCTSAAVRVSRHVTKRDRVAVCGYHGWHEWYAGSTTLNGGIPESVKELTHVFQYNNIDSLHALFQKYPGEIAAVMMEPMNLEEPRDSFLEKVKELTHKNKAIFIFDEVITGFRFAEGGAQQLFNVTPDLAVFGKAMANGMPISTLVGKAEIMAKMEQVFFSSTFAAESLSLAAAIRTIQKIKETNAIKTIWSYGERLKSAVETLIAHNDLKEVMVLKGIAPWVVVTFQDHPKANRNVLRTFFQKEMIRRGVFILSSHNINFAHNEKDFECIVNTYREVLSSMRELLVAGKLEASLDTPVLEPVFKVRNYG